MAWTKIDHRSETEPKGIKACCIQCWGMLGHGEHLLSGWRGEVRIPVVDDGRPGQIMMGVCDGCTIGLTILASTPGI